MAVDRRPRSSAADQALFGEEQSRRVRAASCGAIGAVCTQRLHSSLRSPDPLSASLVSSAAFHCVFNDAPTHGWFLEKMAVKTPAVVSWLRAAAAFRGHEPLLAQPSLSPHGRHRHAAHCVHNAAREWSEGWERRVEV